MSKEGSILSRILMHQKRIATELIIAQTDLIERHLPFALDNYENMIKVAHALCKEPDAISIADIASRAQLSRMRVKDALNDLKNADVVLESPRIRGHFFLRDDLKNSVTPSLDSSRAMIEKARRLKGRHNQCPPGSCQSKTRGHFL